MDLYFLKYIQPDGLYSENPPYYDSDFIMNNASETLWCERYYEPGEFRITARATKELVDHLKSNEFIIARKETDFVMVPDRFEVASDENGEDKLIISGKSGEELLNSRLVLQSTYWQPSSGTAEQAIEFFAKNNILADKYYSDPGNKNIERYLPFLRYSIPQLRKDIFPEKVSIHPYLQPLGDTISAICSACGFGYRLLLDKSTKNLILSAYKGVDRTALQPYNNPVVFSREFNTLSETNCVISRETAYSVLYTDSGASYDNGEGSGVKRREKKIDTSEVGLSDSSGANYKEKITLNGTVLIGSQFLYRKDYDLGDIVTIRNNFGVSGSAIIHEVTEVEDQTGYRVIPAFAQ